MSIKNFNGNDYPCRLQFSSQEPYCTITLPLEYPFYCQCLGVLFLQMLPKLSTMPKGKGLRAETNKQLNHIIYMLKRLEKANHTKLKYGFHRQLMKKQT